MSSETTECVPIVSLVSSSKPSLPKLKDASVEDLIVYIARVSNPPNQLNFKTSSKLLSYCIKHGHWSVFEHAFLTFEINTTRAIAAQILRHRSFTFQEFSQRYSSPSEYIEINPRIQSENNRQSSVDICDGDTIDWFSQKQQEVWNLAQQIFKEGEDRKISRETLRFILPLNTRTTLYMTGTIRSWIHYIQLRSGDDTQLEHRQIAQQIRKLFSNELPNISGALGWTD